MSRREQIRMSDEEVAEFLAAHRVAICATNGTDGWPHLMPLWYVLRDGQLWSWTYAKSQKVRNLERDDRATLEVETGHQYQELRGVMIRARCILHRELDLVAGVGQDLAVRYGGENAAVGPEAREVFERQAAKRVALQFVPQSIASWDHRKLGGVY
jgi:pyridoxamine 5'-phosphate oxidase-like protein